MNVEKRNKNGLTEKEFLEQYNPGDYDRPSVTVDMLVIRMKKELNGLQILLIQRKNHPYIDCFALPGGFIEKDESSYQAACRELEEETSLTDIYMEQLYTMTRPDRDPRMRVIGITYLALLPYSYEKKEHAGDDAKDAAWFDISFSKENLIISNQEKDIRIEYHLKEKIFQNGVLKIKNYIPVEAGEERLAFDHAEVILEGLMRLKNKVEYTDVIFNLVPEHFTLPDLQTAYEITLGRELYKANFRDKIETKVEETGEKAKPITGRRCAKVYRYRDMTDTGCGRETASNCKME